MKTYFKRISALLIAVAMTLAMCTTAFAAGKATITIENAGADAKFGYVQIIQPNPEKTTGWEFTDASYLAAFSKFGTDEQAVIEELIKIVETADSNANFAEALGTIMNTIPEPTESATKEVTSAGVYVIKGTETGYSYNPMAAYVSFGKYDTETGIPQLENAVVNAKKNPTIVEKSNEDADKVTAIGNTVTYTIKSTVPFVPMSQENRQYWVTDTITGAEYVVDADNQMQITVQVGSDINIYTATPQNNRFTLDLTNLLTENTYANDTITISYQAVVTDIEVGNTVQVGKGENDSTFGTDGDEIYTGKIKLTKYAFESEGDKDLTDNVPLAGAVFEVTNKADTTGTPLKFVQKTLGHYVYAPNAAEEIGVTKVEVDPNGELIVEGLDVGEYHFTEVKAPEGYSINENGADAVLALGENETVAISAITAETSLTDTKLSALPSTGGIGTYIFTIAGVVIMAAAAGLFFVKRRRDAE